MHSELPSTLHQIMTLVHHGMSQCDTTPNAHHLEEWSVMIHEVMSARWRKYHTPEHLFEICPGADPLTTLALLFHDLVYIQVDRRIHPKLEAHLKEFPVSEAYELVLPATLENGGDPIVSIAYDVFGFVPGQKLTPTTGINEFLSAMTAVRVLAPYLTIKKLVQILACIEATIAFRPINNRGESPSLALANRLRSVNAKLSLGSDVFVTSSAKLAVGASNRDVGGFASHDTGAFLVNTWKLILEGNPIFKNPMHTINQYRVALMKVEGFFKFLKPDAIFCRYETYPAPQEFQKLRDQAGHNLNKGIQYLQAKIIAVGVLESLAMLSGGDAPIVLFMGEIPTNLKAKTIRMEDYLDPKLPHVAASNFDANVLDLLEHGLNEVADFDLKNSSLASYLYPRLNEGERNLIIEKAKSFFDAKISPKEFLQFIPRPLLGSVVRAVSEIAWTRAHTLHNLLATF